MESSYEKKRMTEEEAAAFIKDNTSFYLEKWKLHSDTAFKGWNWAALFFGIEWMVYRKMYAEAVSVFVAGSCIAVVAAFVLPDFGGDLLGCCVRVLIGAFGNTLYRNKALRILRKMESKEDCARLAALSRSGGVSPVSVFVTILIELVYVFCVLK